LRGAGTDSYRRGIFKIPQRMQKCIDRGGDLVENKKRCPNLSDFLFVYLRFIVG